MGLRQPAADSQEVPLATSSTRLCWCGVEAIEPLGAAYLLCDACGTVVGRLTLGPDELASGDGFYGDHYWRFHVPAVLGLPGLEERARSDLPERSVFHLVKILDHLSPGSRVLELGCGAGTLTYLLRQTGFDAEGLELGPAAIEFARDHFGLEIHRGPLEALGDSGTWDAIVAVDVLEHLPDPLTTITLCAERLGADGRLFLQTPCYRQEGPEWSMLLPKEHIHLFTESSLERLLGAAGFDTVEVEASLFDHDMWAAAGLDGELVKRSDPLSGLPPMVVGIIDAYAENMRTRAERDAIAADRERKQEDVDRLRHELESVRADQEAKARLLRGQDRELRAVRADQVRKDELIGQQDAELEAVRGDQAAKEELLAGISSELEQTREDQRSKGRQIDCLISELESLRRDQAARERLIADSNAELERVRADQRAKELLIGNSATEMESMRRDQAAKAKLIDRLSIELESVRGDQTAKAELIDRLSVELESVRVDQAARAELIGSLSTELESVRGDQAAKAELIDRLSVELETMNGDQRRLEGELKAIGTELEAIRADRRFRLLQAVGVRLGGRS